MPPLLNEASDADAILQRLDGLRRDSERVWGKMSSAQMLAHCRAPLQLALGETELSGNWFLRLLGKMVRKKALSREPFDRNLPTAKSFKIQDEPDFEVERAALKSRIERFRDEGEQLVDGRDHPFFGPMNAEEWGQLQWKHLDHHLRQFGH